nr:26S proteasome non-ATPase regulatory subunit 6-like [Malus domestica]
MEAQEGTQQPHLVLANKLFLLSHSDVPDIEKVQLREEVFASVKADDMAPLYETLVAESMLELDQGVMDSMRAKNQEELKKLDEKIADAEKNLDNFMTGLTEQIKLDRYLHPHFRYYMREIRTVVYSQFLESYKSVTIEAMAKAFGMTVDFIDLELSRFIAAGKLHCKIDKVAGVLETNHPDAKNSLYQATIKQGDFLLNRIQKLSRVIDL